MGVTRRRWLGSLIFGHAHQQQASQTYLHGLDLVDRRVEQFERELDAAAQDARGASWSPGWRPCAPSTR